MKQFFISWRENVMFPLVVSIMFGCIFTAIIQMVELFIPGQRQFDHLTIIAVIAALSSIYSYRTLRVHEIRGEEALRWRLSQLAFLYVLLCLGIYLSERMAGLPAVFSLLSFSLEVVYSLGAILIVWLAANKTATEFERLYQPPDFDIEYIKTERIYISPSTSLMRQFFTGGIIMLIFAGLERAGLVSVAMSEQSFEAGVKQFLAHHQPISGVVGSVFVYFLLGLLLLGQIQFATVRRLWESKNIKIAPELANLWVRYSLGFLVVGTFIALLLPTRYSVTLFDLIQYLGRHGFTWAAYLFNFLFALVTFPLILLSWLLNYLFGSGGEEQAVGPPPVLTFPTPPPPVIQPETGLEMPVWVGLLQSLFFWALTLAIIIYVIRTYLRDNPEFLAALRSLRFMVILASIWKAIRLQFGRLAEIAREAAANEIIQDLIRRAKESRFFHPVQPENLSPKEQVRYYYLSLLHLAGHQSRPRHKTQTPYEYQRTIEPTLTESKQDMADLTEAFVEARYGTEAVTQAEAEQVRAQWEAVKRDLVERKRK